jgi:hypothetical protein
MCQLWCWDFVDDAVLRTMSIEIPSIKTPAQSEKI